MGAREAADAIAIELAAAGGTMMFGVPGGGNNLELVGAADRADIRFVLSHTETGAAIMAATYGDLTGRPTAVIVTRGPGAASAVNGVAQALLDRQPLLVLTDAVPDETYQRISHQRLDQRALFAPVTKASGVVGGAGTAAVTAAAIQLALQAPAGPVHLDFDPTRPAELLPATPPPVSGPTDIEQALELVSKARRPVIALGVGARGVAGQIRALVRGTNIPVLTTYRAKGIAPESSPNAAGLITGATIEAPVLEAADLILAIGLDTVELIPNPWPYQAPVVALAQWPEDSLYFQPAVEVVGPLTTSVAALAPVLTDQWPAGFAVAQRHRATTEVLDNQVAHRGLSPQEVVQVTRAAAPTDAIATVDAGAHMLPSTVLWDTDLVDGLPISSGLATMGFSLPAAIAAAFANPDTRIVCFTGDGGLGMALAELETVVRFNLPITVVLFNDSRLSLIAIKAKPEGHGGSEAITYRDINFAGLAEAAGMTGYQAHTTDELAKALDDSFSLPGPALVDVEVDPTSYPTILNAIRGHRS